MRASVLRYFLLFFMIALIMGCQHQSQPETDLMRVKSKEGEQSKKVVLLLVDSLMSQAIDAGLKQEELPALKYLIDHGHYDKHMVSSFPTMSVTIDSSLMTGKYPDGHQVPGLIWYSTEDKELVNYGTGPMEIYHNGLDRTMMDALHNLNARHLNPQLATIHEELTRRGLTSGSINGLIYRGDLEHTLYVPALLRGTTSLPETLDVKGPELLALGALTNPLKDVKDADLPDGLTNKMGFNDEYSVEVARYLIETDNLPDFLLVYLSDMDQQMHEDGPLHVDGLKDVDQKLQTLLQAFGSAEEALNQAIFVIIGDSGMTQIRSAKDEPNIDLPGLFKEFNMLKPGESVTDDIEIIFAVNQTMAYVYKLTTNKSLKDLAHVAAKDPRMDVVSWKDKEWIHVLKADTGFEMRYKRQGNLRDMYGQKWTVEQREEVLDLKINWDHRRLEYGQYPDVLQRLYASHHSHPGEFLVVTAKPGYELTDLNSPTHEGGGGHGSLYEEESLVPFIISGTDKRPQHLRIIDLKPFILELLSSATDG